MKIASSELFDLIKSLNKEEKKRIRKELFSDNPDKKTLLLYDIIEKQKNFNDEAIQKKAGNPKWYPQLKKYLLEQLTEKISNVDTDKQSYTYVLRSIILAEKLYAKGLMSLAQKKLMQAATLCKTNGWNEYIPIINSRLSNIVGYRNEQRKNYSFYTESFRALNQSYLEKKYSILFRCLEFSNDLDEPRQFINELRINEYLSDEKQLTTLQQKLHYYQFFASYYKRVELDHIRSFYYCKKYIEVILESNLEAEKRGEGSEEQRARRLRNNVVGLLNLIIAAVNANLLSEADELYNTFVILKSKVDKLNNAELVLFHAENSLMLFFLISAANNTRRGHEALDFDPHVRQFYLSEKKFSQETIVICYEQIAFYFFMKTKWSDCNVLVNKIINDNELYKTYPDTYSNMLLLRLFLNFETGDVDVLDYNLKKAGRYFEKRYPALAYEKLILSFLDEIVTGGQTERISLMKKYKEKFERLMLSDKIFALTYLSDRMFVDFGSWLESKIESRPLVEILRKKALLE
jgi:hypothetical protein